MPPTTGDAAPGAPDGVPGTGRASMWDPVGVEAPVATGGPRRRHRPRRRLRLRVPTVRLAAAIAALVVSVAVTAASLAGGAGRRDVPVATPPSAAATSTAGTTALDREVARLQVDLAVARATWSGAGQVDPTTAAQLEQAIAQTQSWLDTWARPASAAEEVTLLREVADLRATLTSLVTALGGKVTTTPAPTPSPSPTRARPTPSRAATPAPAPRTTTPPPEPPPAPPAATAAPTAPATTPPAPDPTTAAPEPTPTPTAEPTDPPGGGRTDPEPGPDGG